MCAKIHPGDRNCHHEKSSKYGISDLLLLVQKLKDENTHDSSELCMSARISIVFGAVISDISHTVVCPVWPGCTVEGLADGEKIGIEEREDDSDESCHFLLGKKDVETGNGDDEHGVD